MTDISPEAYFDALVIMNDAPASVLPLSINEMHLYSYLGCVFALFKGRPLAEWGYSFALTSEGFPFSVDLDRARSTLSVTGLIDQDDDGRMESRPDELNAELEMLFNASPWRARRPWIRAATECPLALPLGSIRHAVNRSPGVASSFLLGQRARLLEPADVTLLYDEYAVVSSVLGTDTEDILSPAVVWLTARILRREDADV